MKDNKTIFSSKIAVLLLVLFVAVSACKKDDPENNSPVGQSPTVTIETPATDTIDVYTGETFDVKIVAQSNQTSGRLLSWFGLERGFEHEIPATVLNKSISTTEYTYETDTLRANDNEGFETFTFGVEDMSGQSNDISLYVKTIHNPVSLFPEIRFIEAVGFLHHDTTIYTGIPCQIGISAESNMITNAKLTHFMVSREVNSLPVTVIDSIINVNNFNITINETSLAIEATEIWKFSISDHENRTNEISLTIITETP